MKVTTIYLVNLWNILSLAQRMNRGTEEVLTKHWLLFWKTLWASLIAQLVKNLYAVQETLVPFLAGEDLLEKR